MGVQHRRSVSRPVNRCVFNQSRTAEKMSTRTRPWAAHPPVPAPLFAPVPPPVAPVSPASTCPEAAARATGFLLGPGGALPSSSEPPAADPSSASCAPEICAERFDRDRGVMADDSRSLFWKATERSKHHREPALTMFLCVAHRPAHMRREDSTPRDASARGGGWIGRSISAEKPHTDQRKGEGSCKGSRTRCPLH